MNWGEGGERHTTQAITVSFRVPKILEQKLNFCLPYSLFHPYALH